MSRFVGPASTGRVKSGEIWRPEDVVAARERGGLPARFVVPAPAAGIHTLGQPLVIVQAPPRPGDVACLVSGERLAFRRVLAVHGTLLRLRCDIGPFEDRWDAPIVGCAVSRPIDRLAALDPERFTELGWRAAMAAARYAAAQQRFLRTRGGPRLTVASLEDSDWPRVRAFWAATTDQTLAPFAAGYQHAVGLFDRRTLVGVNIHLQVGNASYSAFTLVDRRYRGVGGGRKMIERAVEDARLRGLSLVYVHIHARNLPSIAAYSAVGFRAVRWWADDADPLLSAERQWRVFEIGL